MAIYSYTERASRPVQNTTTTPLSDDLEPMPTNFVEQTFVATLHYSPAKVSDAVFVSAPRFVREDVSGWGWAVSTLGLVAQMCTNGPQVKQKRPRGGAFCCEGSAPVV